MTLYLKHKEGNCLQLPPTLDSRCLEAAGTTTACWQPVGSLQAADTPLPAARTANRRDPASGAMGVRLSFAAATPALQTFTIFSLASLLREEVALLRVATVDTTCREQDRAGRSSQHLSKHIQCLHLCRPYTAIWQAPKKSQMASSLFMNTDQCCTAPVPWSWGRRSGC